MGCRFFIRLSRRFDMQDALVLTVRSLVLGHRDRPRSRLWLGCLCRAPTGARRECTPVGDREERLLGSSQMAAGEIPEG